MKVLNLEDPATWPSDVLAHLDAHYDVFHGWETGTNRPAARAYDEAAMELIRLLRSSGYTIRGYHCTRLTDAEMTEIITHGMMLPNAELLTKRLHAVDNTGQFPDGIAQRLNNENEAHQPYRTAMIWFCFFPPYIAGQGGIERFFRHWGGESLYVRHEEDEVTGSALRKIGIPCIVEALVPIRALEFYGGLDTKIVRRYLVSMGLETVEPIEHEDRAVEPLPAANIIGIIKYPEPRFIELSRCHNWVPGLAG